MSDIAHKDGVTWFDAPLPSRWHRCHPWSLGWLGPFVKYERCACGAVRRNGHGWMERNQRRRRKAA